MESVFVGIEIGGTKIQVVTGDDQAQVVTRNRFNADLAKGAEGIREQLAAALADIAKRQQSPPSGLASADHSIAKPAEPAARTKSKAGMIFRSATG